MLHRQSWRWVVALLIAVATTGAQAMPVKFRSANFKYVVDGKPIRDVLRDFGASQAMVVAVAPDVEGSVVGKFDLTPRQFIDLLALSYGFVYYYNGAVLHVSAAQGMRSTLVRLNYARIAQLRETLERMNVAEPRFPIVYDEAANTALVAGPQEYVDVIREIAVQLERRTQTGGRSVTRVFPLRFGWADDRKSGEDTSPGMASLLQALYSGQATATTGATDRPGRAGSAPGLRAETSLSSLVAPALGNAAPPAAPVDDKLLSLRRTFSLGSAAGPAASSSTSFSPTTMPPRTVDPDALDREEEQLPVIVADPATNSIVIRDLPERMPAYEALITSLDVQPRLVEIAVQIIDLTDDALEEFGIDWSLHTRRVDAGSGDTGAEATGGGLLTAVLGDSGRALLGRVSALEKKGLARVSSRPRVATLNNQTAVMSSEKSFYVKVSGYQSTSLYNVSAGLDMRVTPMATVGPEGYRIRLDVQVEDGQISATEVVGDLPTVTRSQIATQAIVRQDESLLLAGHVVEQNNDRVTAVPVLGDLPVVGALFRQKSHDRSRSERLFLVTPRVLD